MIFYCIMRFIMAKSYRKSILEILSGAEEALLEIVGQAATLGDYSGIDLARGTAGEIKRISTRISSEISKLGNVTTDIEGSKPHQKKPDSFAKQSRYPRFEINETILTKVGWSRNQKKEYIHRINRDVFDEVVLALSTAEVDKGSPVQTKLIQKVLKNKGSVTPSYQVYSVLGFLRSRGTIRLSARGSYIVPSNVSERAHAEWLKTEREGK